MAPLFKSIFNIRLFQSKKQYRGHLPYPHGLLPWLRYQDKFWTHCAEEWADSDITAENILEKTHAAATTYLAKLEAMDD